MLHIDPSPLILHPLSRIQDFAFGLGRPRTARTELRSNSASSQIGTQVFERQGFARHDLRAIRFP
jgi:hypothetical protein